jgi:hypothetical protein
MFRTLFGRMLDMESVLVITGNKASASISKATRLLSNLEQLGTEEKTSERSTLGEDWTRHVWDDSRECGNQRWIRKWLRYEVHAGLKDKQS